MLSEEAEMKVSSDRDGRSPNLKLTDSASALLLRRRHFRLGERGPGFLCCTIMQTRRCGSVSIHLRRGGFEGSRELARPPLSPFRLTRDDTSALRLAACTHLDLR